MITSGLYVAVDGNYGDAAGMSIIDDTNWEQSDYALLEEASDGRRAELADAIDLWIKDGRPAFKDYNPDEEYLSYLIVEKYIKN